MKNIVFAFCAYACVVGAGEPPIPDPLKLSIPMKEALDKELQKITLVFSEELKSAKTEVKIAVAEKMQQLSREEKNKDTKYALLLKSREIAIDQLAAHLVCGSTYAILEDFNVDKLRELTFTLQSLIKKVNGINDAHPSIQLYGKETVVDGFRVNIITLIEYCSHLALNKQKLDDLKYLSTVFNWMNTNQWETPKLKVRANRVKLALEMLGTTNINPAMYDVLVNNQWKTGLTKLAENSAVSQIALQEQKAATAEDKLNVVEVWMQWTNTQKLFKAKEQVDRSVGVHCINLLQDAMPELSGLSKAKAEKLFANLDQRFPSVKEAPTPATPNAENNVRDEVTELTIQLIQKPYDSYTAASRAYSEAYDGFLKQWQQMEPGMRNSCVIAIVHEDGSTSTRFDQAKYDQYAANFRDNGNKTLVPLKTSADAARQELQRAKSEFLTIFKQKAFQNADEKSQNNLKNATETLLQFPDR